MKQESIINTVCIATGFLLDAILIYTYILNRRTATKTNLILLNYAVSQIIGGTTLITIYAVDDNKFCLVDAGETFYQLSSMLILFILAFEYTAELKKLDFSILLGLVWTLSLFVCSLSAGLSCTYNATHPVEVILLTVYAVCLTSLLLSFVRHCWKAQFNARLTISLCYTALSTVGVLRISGLFVRVLDEIAAATLPLQFLYAAVLTVYFYRKDGHFRQSLGCGGVAEEALSESGSEDNFSVNISYSRTS